MTGFRSGLKSIYTTNNVCLLHFFNFLMAYRFVGTSHIKKVFTRQGQKVYCFSYNKNVHSGPQ